MSFSLSLCCGLRASTCAGPFNSIGSGGFFSTGVRRCSPTGSDHLFSTAGPKLLFFFPILSVFAVLRVPSGSNHLWPESVC